MVGMSLGTGGATEIALIYARCSTEEQANEGVSLAVQVERFRACAALAGVEELQDAGVSGGKPLAARPGGQPSACSPRTEPATWSS